MIGKRPYTPGYVAGEWLIVSGQTGRVGEQLAEGFDAQFHQAFANVRAILSGHGLDLGAAAKITIYLARMEQDYGRMNELYTELFSKYADSPKPARTTSVWRHCRARRWLKWRRGPTLVDGRGQQGRVTVNNCFY
jgi:2-iminobutanoate/2-iminopropanoate deaminase